jgi:hypothetical protein
MRALLHPKSLRGGVGRVESPRQLNIAGLPTYLNASRNPFRIRTGKVKAKGHNWPQWAITAN